MMFPGRQSVQQRVVTGPEWSPGVRPGYAGFGLIVPGLQCLHKVVHVQVFVLVCDHIWPPGMSKYLYLGAIIPCHGECPSICI